MISEVYDAFLSVGVPDDHARRAAEALSADSSATKSDIQKLDKRLGDCATKSDIQKLDKRIDLVEAELRLIKWMLGFVLAFCLIMLPMMLSIMWKLFADPSNPKGWSAIDGGFGGTSYINEHTGVVATQNEKGEFTYNNLGEGYKAQQQQQALSALPLGAQNYIKRLNQMNYPYQIVREDGKLFVVVVAEDGVSKREFKYK